MICVDADACPDCGETRLSEEACASGVRGISPAKACTMTIKMRPMAIRNCESFYGVAKRLIDLGLSVSIPPIWKG